MTRESLLNEIATDAGDRSLAAACERAIAEVFAAAEAAADTMSLGAFQDGPAAEILARHGVTVEQMLEHLRGNALGA